MKQTLEMSFVFNQGGGKKSDDGEGGKSGDPDGVGIVMELGTSAEGGVSDLL